MRCVTCGGRLSGAMLEILRGISALPDALGAHACEECGHPEMLRLPDGTFHCPACRSEVLPIDVSLPPAESEKSLAYWAGWADGRYGEKGNLADNRNLPRWESPFDRLAYYRGHRAGSGAHQSRTSQNPDAREKLFG